VKLEFTEISMIEIESFYNQILEDINKFTGETYTVDFSAVEILSLPAIQVLISLKNYCDNQNIKLECINIYSNSIIQLLETYNLKEKLGVK